MSPTPKPLHVPARNTSKIAAIDFIFSNFLQTFTREDWNSKTRLRDVSIVDETNFQREILFRVIVSAKLIALLPKRQPNHFFRRADGQAGARPGSHQSMKTWYVCTVHYFSEQSSRSEKSSVDENALLVPVRMYIFQNSQAVLKSHQSMKTRYVCTFFRTVKPF